MRKLLNILIIFWVEQRLRRRMNTFEILLLEISNVFVPVFEIVGFVDIINTVHIRLVLPSFVVSSCVIADVSMNVESWKIFSRFLVTQRYFRTLGAHCVH